MFWAGLINITGLFGFRRIDFHTGILFGFRCNNYFSTSFNVSLTVLITQPALKLKFESRPEHEETRLRGQKLDATVRTLPDETWVNIVSISTHRAFETHDVAVKALTCIWSFLSHFSCISELSYEERLLRIHDVPSRRVCTH